MLVAARPSGVERLGGDGGGEKAECEGEVVHGGVLDGDKVEPEAAGLVVAGGKDDAVQEAAEGDGYLYRTGQEHAGNGGDAGGADREEAEMVVERRMKRLGWGHGDDTERRGSHVVTSRGSARWRRAEEVCGVSCGSLLSVLPSWPNVR